MQRIKMGTARAGQLAHVWADEFTVYVLIGGQLVKTVPSSLDAEDLATLRVRGARPAGPPPAALAPASWLACRDAGVRPPRAAASRLIARDGDLARDEPKTLRPGAARHRPADPRRSATLDEDLRELALARGHRR
jgi:hypothetical protein